MVEVDGGHEAMGERCGVGYGLRSVGGEECFVQRGTGEKTGDGAGVKRGGQSVELYLRIDVILDNP